MLKAEIHQRAVRCCPQRYLRSWMSPELRGTQPMERGTGAVRSLPDWVILWFSMQLFPLYHLWKGKAVETCTCMGVTFRNFVQPPGKCRQGLWMLPSTKKLKLCCTGVRNWPCITWTECLKQLMHRIIYKYFPGWKILSEGIPCVTNKVQKPACTSLIWCQSTECILPSLGFGYGGSELQEPSWWLWRDLLHWHLWEDSGGSWSAWGSSPDGHVPMLSSQWRIQEGKDMLFG